MVRPLTNIVWFKRDLRVQDHHALAAAAKHEIPALLIYIFEPSMMQARDSDERHWRFVWQSLQDMNRHLHGKSIHIFKGEATEVLNMLWIKYDIRYMFSHQETGNAVSFARDKAVDVWCRKHGVPWQQFQDRGVYRGAGVRKKWNERWFDYMSLPPLQINLDQLQAHVMKMHPMQVHQFQDLFPYAPLYNRFFQPGGASSGQLYLQTFLQERGLYYQRNISKPALSRISCSRLSPYLAYGNLSLRQIFHQVRYRQLEDHEFKRPLELFQSRLLWHSHFIQKFETRCSLEFENTNPGFNGLRTQPNDTWIEAWENGQTGIPLIDACMRCLRETGYLNFRMRAMLVSFFTHHLWQPWQQGVHFLARQFLDYEPGIHFPQFQMQAGVTGINTIRIYNPVKQGLEHDTDGSFVKKWLPELALVPDPFVHEPWKMNPFEQHSSGVELGHHYPFPIVDLATAARHARQELWKVKDSPEVKKYNKNILGTLTGRLREDEGDA